MPNPTLTEAAVATLPTYAFWLTMIGAFFFGLVVGWVTYSTLRRAGAGGSRTSQPSSGRWPERR